MVIKGQSTKSKRAILFKEPIEDRILPAGNDKELAKSCLLVLRERFENPMWNYSPKRELELSKDEEDFIKFWERESKFLPDLLYHSGERIYSRIISDAPQQDTPEKRWYKSVKELLALPENIAVDYKVIHSGRYIPTSYYLLSRRKSYPDEDFLLVELIQP